MKKFSPLFTFLFFANISFSQTSLVNFKEGTWKNKQSWLYQQIPADTNDVVLMHDIVVDINAVCRSLTTNGYNIAVQNGFRLTITGKDSAPPSAEDTLVAEILVTSADDGSSTEILEVEDSIVYSYDQLKRMTNFTEYYYGYKYQVQNSFSGNDRLPYKSVWTDFCSYESDGNCIPNYDTSFFTYNADGIVIKDSNNSTHTERQLNYKRVNNYYIKGDSVVNYSLFNNFSISYEGDKEIVTEYFDNDTTYYFRKLENGNIIYQTDSSEYWQCEHISTYDKKHNPLFKNTIPFAVLPAEKNFVANDPEQHNNTLLYEENYSYFGSDSHTKYKYAIRYNKNNYPVETIVFSEEDDTVYIIKYKYTK